MKIKNSKLVTSFLILISILFLGFNIFQSQSISSLFSDVVNGQRQGVVDYLKKIMELPQFKGELENYKSNYGASLEDEVFSDEKKREEKIALYEQILQKNSKSRDILYGLYLLYKEEGDNSRAQDYLRQAKEIDPDIK